MVSAAPSSSLAKSFSSAAALYMTTRRPTFAAQRKTNLKAALKAGSFSTINPSLLYEQRLSPTLDLSMSGEYLYTSGRYRFTYKKKDGYDTTSVRHNGDVHSLRLETGLFGRLDEGEWRAKAYLYRSERGYPGAFVREEPGKFKHEDRQWDTDVRRKAHCARPLGSTPCWPMRSTPTTTSTTSPTHGWM